MRLARPKMADGGAVDDTWKDVRIPSGRFDELGSTWREDEAARAEAQRERAQRAILSYSTRGYPEHVIIPELPTWPEVGQKVMRGLG